VRNGRGAEDGGVAWSAAGLGVVAGRGGERHVVRLAAAVCHRGRLQIASVLQHQAGRARRRAPSLRLLSEKRK
jgi:hypothetical protein